MLGQVCLPARPRARLPHSFVFCAFRFKCDRCFSSHTSKNALLVHQSKFHRKSKRTRGFVSFMGNIQGLYYCDACRLYTENQYAAKHLACSTSEHATAMSSSGGGDDDDLEIYFTRKSLLAQIVKLEDDNLRKIELV